MENDDSMRLCMETLLPYFFPHVRFKNAAPDLHITLSKEITEFLHNMKTVLQVKTILIYNIWEPFCEISCSNALSTHEMYFRYIMFACHIQITFFENIFEKVVSAFALVMHYNIETLINAGVDFCELSVDIFMVFYKRTLEKAFYKQGGFKKFAEYLRRHEYLTLENYIQNSSEVSDHHLLKQHSFLQNLYCKTQKEVEKSLYNPNFIKHAEVIKNENCEYLAREILSTTKIRLPALKTPTDLNMRFHAAKQQKAELRALLKPQNSCSLKHEMTSIFLNNETTGTPSSGKMASPILERETINRNVEHEKSNRDVERETINRNVEHEKSNRDVERGTTNTEVERETTKKNMERETMDSYVKREATKTDLKHDRIIKSSKYKTMTAAPGQSEIGESTLVRKALREDFNSVTKETSSKRKQTEASSKTESMEKVLQGSANRAKQTMEVDWCEDVVQKVIKYNCSKCLAGDKNQIYSKADKLLQKLWNATKYLIDVLEDFDEES